MLYSCMWLASLYCCLHYMRLYCVSRLYTILLCVETYGLFEVLCSMNSSARILSFISA